jgi:hypothetical protein
MQPAVFDYPLLSLSHSGSAIDRAGHSELLRFTALTNSLVEYDANAAAPHHAAAWSCCIVICRQHINADVAKLQRRVFAPRPGTLEIGGHIPRCHLIDNFRNAQRYRAARPQLPDAAFKRNGSTKSTPFTSLSGIHALPLRSTVPTGFKTLPGSGRERHLSVKRTVTQLHFPVWRDQRLEYGQRLFRPPGVAA